MEKGEGNEKGCFHSVGTIDGTAAIRLLAKAIAIRESGSSYFLPLTGLQTPSRSKNMPLTGLQTPSRSKNMPLTGLQAPSRSKNIPLTGLQTPSQQSGLGFLAQN